MISKRDIGLVGMSMLLGPLVGLAVFFVLAFAVSPFTGAPAGGMWSMIGVLIVGAFAGGAIPAFISAVANAVLSRRIEPARRRVLWALPVGAVSALVGLGWAAFQPGHGTVPAPLFLVVMAVVGAAASAVSVAAIEYIAGPPQTA